MSSLLHTYGPTCQLAQNTTKPASDGDDIPRVKAQFFYTSPLPIDDPLSAVPIPNESVTRHPPRPFSAYDNKALEEAWLGLASEKDRKHHFKGNLPQWATKDDAERRAAILKRAATKKNDMKKAQEEERKAQSTMSKIESASEAVKDGVLHAFPDVGKALDDVLDISTSSTSQGQKQDKDKAKREASKEGRKDESKEQGSQDTTKAKEKTHEKSHSGKEKHSDPIAQHDGPKDIKKSAGDKDITDSKGKEHKASGKHSDSKSNKEHEKLQIHDLAEEAHPASPTRPGQGGPAGITGNPFARVPSHKASPLSQAPTLSNRDDELHSTLDEALAGDGPPSRSASTREPSEETMQIAGCKAHRNSKEKDDVEIPVGISRLHLVKLPALQMKPIYWSPIHDGAAVTRGTWFYKDTMLPVEPPVANQLEIGYRELRPWSQTWKDELNSALEVGAAGEEKIVHRLWPKDDEPQDSSKKFDRHGDVKSSSEPLLSTDPYCAAKCFNGEAAAAGTLEDEKPSDTATIVKRYPNSQVIYKNSSHAFILKQSLIPSAYYGRKPLTKIMRGHTVGVHVVRGFDWKTWDKLHPSKKTAITTKAEENAPASGDANANKTATCEACRSAEERPEVTDLVLVVHGIGQKLSERVESFHFTHAINAFRRSVNIELASEAVQPVLRKGLGGVMVLPVNWRSNLSFEDGGPKKGIDKDKDYKNPDDFTLKDITPNTIPAVRSLISDVMLDIPFYMSHHKPKMIEALVTEANRVYALWNKNNPGFKNNGRVHIIAHSLGSVMALDVLSHQPSVVPKYNLGKKINAKHFDFETTNLFFVGSPAGFFLLLERGNLSPRRGRSKPGADLEDVNSRKGTTNDEGTFGSLAVDNVYNIMHYNDPIAYRVNATVDPLYAASLKDAQVPSATTGFFQAMGKAIKSITPGVSSPADLGVGQLSKPPAIQRLPSTLEMEVHDFTREEIAERKFFLLNDNGQVDWFLSSGGGPLEIQYINMLGAHSSYWGSPDFVRMIVTEVGRTPGKDNTLPNLRAIKVGQHKRK